MLSNSRSWASGGRYISKPSALQDGRLRRVKPAAAQGGRPVLPQIDGNGSPVRGRGGAQVGHRGALELDDLGLIDLVDHAAGRPGQPVGARVEAGGQNHRLADTVAGGVEKEIVEEPGAHGDRIGLELQVPLAVVVAPPGRTSPSTRRMKKSRPTARTSGAANGSLMIASVLRAGQRARGGDHRGRGADAGGQVPGVLIGACHGAPVEPSQRPVSILSKCNEPPELYAFRGSFGGSAVILQRPFDRT